MRAKKKTLSQEDLFKSRLDQMLNENHPLFRLANSFDWSYFEKEFGSLYVENTGRPGKPIRLMVGLHYLKHAYNVSDESVVENFIENPYWQYFCGFEYFQHNFPLDPTSLVKWRQRIGADGVEKLLAGTINTAMNTKLLRERHFAKVNVDTTVQEKAVTFPTDAGLYYKMREKLVKAAEENDIVLRRNYNRLAKRSLIMKQRYGHARQYNRAKKETKKLKNYLGRVARDIERKLPEPNSEMDKLLKLANRLLLQKRSDSNKLYSLHETEVECIAKGKVHKRYEFGCKVSVATTSRDNWVIGIEAHPGNPYDGHSLKDILAQTERITDRTVKEVYCDRGYQGHDYVGETKIIVAPRKTKKKTRMSRTQKKWMKRRNAIEPVIGHLKTDNRMGRNFLKGVAGDRINAILAGCGANLRKLIRAFLRLFSKKLNIEEILFNIHQTILNKQQIVFIGNI